MAGEIDTFDCPSCGGPLDAHNAKNNLVTCPFCGKNVIVPESLRPQAAQNITIHIPGYTPPADAASVVGTAAAEQAARRSAPRWVSCLVIGIIAVSLISAAAAVAAPLLAAGFITQAVEGVIPTAESVSIQVPTMPALQTAEALAQVTPTPTPTPGPAERTLAFGEEGSGPGMFNDTRWVAAHPDGSFFTADYQDGRIQKFDAEGKFVLLWNAGRDVIIQDLAVRRDGVVLAAAGGKILKFDGQTGAALGEVAYPAGGNFSSLAASADGGFVAVNDGENVVRFGPDEQVTLEIPDAVSTITDDSELSSRVAVDGLGNIYLLGTFNYAVFVFTAEGKFTNRIGSRGDEVDTLRAPNDLAVDGKGRVFISDIMGVKIFTTDGRFVNLIDVEGAAFGLAVDDQNRLFAASNAPMLSRFEVK